MFAGLIRDLRVGAAFLLNLAVTVCVVVAVLLVALAFLVLPYSILPHRKPSEGFGVPHAPEK
jgi:hypothetical protein